MIYYTLELFYQRSHKNYAFGYNKTNNAQNIKGQRSINKIYRLNIMTYLSSIFMLMLHLFFEKCYLSPISVKVTTEITSGHPPVLKYRWLPVVTFQWLTTDHLTVCKQLPLVIHQTVSNMCERSLLCERGPGVITAEWERIRGNHYCMREDQK